MKAIAVSLCLSILSAIWPVAAVATIRSPHETLDPSLTKDAVHAVRLGVQWLEAHQQEGGYWSNASFPAMTALAVSAILNSPDIVAAGAVPESASRGVAFLLRCVQPDGCIYQPVEGVKGGGMPNYNTSLSLLALANAGTMVDAGVIERARACLMRSQYLGPGVFHGGMGYDAEHDRAYADLSNTLFALEALRRTMPVQEEQQAATQPSLNFEAAIAFVSRCQHLRESNPSSWVRDTTEERGGFVYHPEKSMAGEAESSDDGGTYLRSYGSMTYAGLLSFLYADVSRDDPRVLAAVEWLERHWTLDENPRMGAQGLYYHYHTMAKALNAYGKETLTLPDGRTVNWRPALVQKLISLQQIEPETGTGFWRNENNRWWENDPCLVTAYTLLALETALFGIPPSASLR